MRPPVFHTLVEDGTARRALIGGEQPHARLLAALEDPARLTVVNVWPLKAVVVAHTRHGEGWRTDVQIGGLVMAYFTPCPMGLEHRWSFVTEPPRHAIRLTPALLYEPTT